MSKKVEDAHVLKIRESIMEDKKRIAYEQVYASKIHKVADAFADDKSPMAHYILYFLHVKKDEFWDFYKKSEASPMSRYERKSVDELMPAYSRYLDEKYD